MKAQLLKNLLSLPMATGSFLLLFLFLTLGPGPLTLYSVFAADWQLNMKVTVPHAMGERGLATQKIALGQQLTAGNEYDNVWDTVSYGSAGLSAYSYRPDLPVNQQLLVRDFRGDALPQQWELLIGSDQNGQPMTIEWSPLTLPTGGCQMIVSLTDVTAGTAVDLGQLSYQYTNSAGQMRQFRVDASADPSMQPPAPYNLSNPRIKRLRPRLIWDAIDDPAVVGYHIYRKSASSPDYQRLTASPTDRQRYGDRTITSAGDYTYQVTATTAEGCESPPSNEVLVTIP